MKSRVGVHWDKNLKKWRIYLGNEQVWATSVTLRNVMFFVVPEGQEMVRERKKEGMTEADARFPHAFIFGKLTEEEVGGSYKDFTYNPFKHENFIYVTGAGTEQELTEASVVKLDIEDGKPTMGFLF